MATLARLLPWLAPALLPLTGQTITPPAGMEERFQQPPGIRWGYFRNADNARIRYCRVPAAGGVAARATVVLLPGYSEFAEKYFETMREFSLRGGEVWQMDWRGYGGSDRYLADPEKAHSLGADRDTRDLDQFVREIVQRAPEKPFLLAAHSLGGLFAVRYLHDYPGRFTAAALSAPFLSLAPGATEGIPEWLVRTMVWSSVALGWGQAWAKGSGPWQDKPVWKLSHDPVRSEIHRRWTRANPTLRIGGVTNAWVRESIRSFDTIGRPGYLEAIPTRVLLGSAGEDVLTRPDAQARACSQMPGCRLIRLDGAWHELFMESDGFRGRWMDAVAALTER